MACDLHGNRACFRNVPIFKDLTAEEAERLAETVRSKRYKKGEIVFREGEKSETLFVLNEGTVKISKMSDTGKEQILRILFPGDFFGLSSMLHDKTHYANAEVLDPAVICFIKKQDFRKMMERNPKLAYRVLLAVSERLEQTDEWLGTISLMEADRRLAKLLLLFYEKNGAQTVMRLPAQKKGAGCLFGHNSRNVEPETRPL